MSRAKARKRKMEDNDSATPNKKPFSLHVSCYDEKGLGVSGDVLDIKLLEFGEHVHILIAAADQEILFDWKSGTKNAWALDWRLPCNAEENITLHKYVDQLVETFCEKDCLYYLDREQNQIDLT